MPDLTMALATIRKHSPCEDGWKNLLRSLGYADGTYDRKRRVSLGDIAQSNGAADALWCLRCLKWRDVRHAVIGGVILPAARRAAKHTTDERVHQCLAAIEQWLHGADVDLEAAYAAASEAAANAYAAAASDAAASEAAAYAANAAAASTSAGAAYAASISAGAAYAASISAGAAYAAFYTERDLQRKDLISLCGLRTTETAPC